MRIVGKKLINEEWSGVNLCQKYFLFVIRTKTKSKGDCLCKFSLLMKTKIQTITTPEKGFSKPDNRGDYIVVNC